MAQERENDKTKVTSTVGESVGEFFVLPRNFFVSLELFLDKKKQKTRSQRL